MKSSSHFQDRIKSILIRVLALIAFLTINFIGFRAFSYESPCRVVSEGPVEGQWKKVRIQVDDEIIAGADSLSELQQQWKGLVSENKCIPSSVTCRFASAGWAMGSWVQHRIRADDQTVTGANSMAELFDQMALLQKMGICE